MLSLLAYSKSVITGVAVEVGFVVDVATCVLEVGVPTGVVVGVGVDVASR